MIEKYVRLIYNTYISNTADIHAIMYIKICINIVLFWIHLIIHKGVYNKSNNKKSICSLFQLYESQQGNRKDWFWQIDQAICHY